MKYLICVATLFLFGFSVFGQNGKLVGKKPAPDLNLVTLDKKTINTRDLLGKVVVYNLWYVGCPPCRTEIPELNKIVEEYKDKDVVFLGLTTDNKNNLDKFFKEVPFNYQIVPNAGQIMLFNFGDAEADGSIYIPFPMHIVVNREGFFELKVSGQKGVAAVREELKRQFTDAAPKKSEAESKEKKAN